MFKKLRVVKFHAISLLYDLKAKVRPYKSDPDRLKEKVTQVFGEEVYEVNIWDDPETYVRVIGILEEYYDNYRTQYNRWHQLVLKLNDKDDELVVDCTIPGYIMITER